MKARTKDGEPSYEPSSRKSSAGPRIIVQYRAKAAKVYELQSNGAVVAVRITQNEDEAASSGWHIDAQSDCTRGLSVVEGRGNTAAEALKDVARVWIEHRPPLTIFDWEAIARELHVVNAI